MTMGRQKRVRANKKKVHRGGTRVPRPSPTKPAVLLPALSHGYCDICTVVAAAADETQPTHGVFLYLYGLVTRLIGALLLVTMIL